MSKRSRRQEAETEPPAEDINAPALVEARGYRVESWRGMPNYVSVVSAYACLNETAMQLHVAEVRRRARLQETLGYRSPLVLDSNGEPMEG